MPTDCMQRCNTEVRLNHSSTHLLCTKICTLYVYTAGRTCQFGKVPDLLRLVISLHDVYYTGAHLVYLYTLHAYIHANMPGFGRLQCLHSTYCQHASHSCEIPRMHNTT